VPDPLTVKVALCHAHTVKSLGPLAVVGAGMTVIVTVALPLSAVPSLAL